MQLHSKTTFLTGASSGIGWELALQLAAQNGRVAIAARRLNLLEDLAEHIKRAGGEALPIELDVTDPDAVRDAVQETVSTFGSLDLVIANAGVSSNAEAAQYSDQTIRTMVDVNLLGAIWTVRAGLDAMLLQSSGGTIVGISSLASVRGLPTSSVYSATKSGLNAFLESVRIEYEPRGVDVCIINPGFIKTPMTDKNPHSMPFMIEAPEAATQILDAIKDNRNVYGFPRPTDTLTRLGRLMPDALYDRLVRKMRS